MGGTDQAGTGTAERRGGRTGEARFGPFWKAAAVAAGLVLAGLAVNRAEAALGTPEHFPAEPAVRALLTAAVLLPLLVAARRFFGRRSWTELGLSSLRTGWRPLLLGAACWTLPVALIAGSAVFGWAQTTGALSPGEAALLAAGVLPLALIRMLSEELVFRGYLQGGLTARIGVWPAVFAQAALFALWGCLAAGDVSPAADLLLSGILMGVLRNVTGGLWTGIGLGTAALVGSRLFAETGFEFTESAPDLLHAANAFLPLIVVLTAVLARPHWFAAQTAPAASVHHRSGADGRAARGGLTQRGILYDVGSSYAPGQHSRRVWRPDVVRREMLVIRDELHCNAVTVFGRDTGRLIEGARIALEAGLAVWLQPRTVDSAPDEMLAHLAETAQAAERLRHRHPGLGLSVGCELSAFTSGCLPGANFEQRFAALRLLPLTPLYNRRLNRLLARAADLARTHFGGPITYGAGSWESVDWDVFDVIGLDHYWDLGTQAHYLDRLRRCYRYGKPVIVAEFGCASYKGASLQGGNGSAIMDWSDLEDRKIRGSFTRDEQVQADYIGELIEMFESEDLHGAFVCMFIEGDHPYSPDPRRDLDMASLGIVRPYPAESGKSADDGHWEPKAAFHEIARRFGAHPPP